jgi:hypothetical protein
MIFLRHRGKQGEIGAVCWLFSVFRGGKNDEKFVGATLDTH